MNYDPKPIDTSLVKLPSEILELTEHLAKHAHDVWALERLSQGWTWGLGRDDEGKKHPCLVPYGQLTDDEKKFDRNVAMGTLKAIVALGYRIEKMPCDDDAGK